MDVKRLVLHLGSVICSFVFAASSWGQLQNAPWPMFHRDVRHTGLSPYAGPSDPVLAWSYKISSALVGNPVPSSAIGSDGTVYAGAYQKLFTFNPDGTLAWSYSTGAFGRTTPPALGSDGKVYMGDEDGYFSALNSNGTLTWQTSLGGGIKSGAALGSGGVIYVGGGSLNYRIYSLNSNGTVNWSYRTGYLVNCSPALGSDEVVYVGSLDNRLYALNSHGMLSWSYLTGGYVASSPAIGSDERVYVGSYDNMFYAFNLEGTLHWSYLAGSYVASSPSLGSDGGIYFGSDDLVFYCIKQIPTVTPIPTITPTPTDTPPISLTVTPTPTTSGVPTTTPTATQFPSLIVRPGPLAAGQNFSVYLALTKDITQPFDFYFFVATPVGSYTLYLNGKITKGIVPLYRNVQSFTKDYITTVRPSVRIPAGMTGKTVTFYAVFTQAGKKPSVSRVSDLMPDTPHIILMDAASASVNP